MKDIQLLNEKQGVDSYLNRNPRPLSSFSFISIFAWCDFFDFEFKTINDCLCVFAHGGQGSFLYLPPLGQRLDPSTIELVFKHMTKGQAPKPINRIENIPGNILSAFGLDSYNHFTKPPEYVYRKEDLVALKGNAYKSQRHDCNYFLTHHPLPDFGPYEDADFSSCMELYARWADNRARTHSDDKVYISMLQENARVHARLLKYQRPLGLIARVLKIEGKIVGYTFGFSLDDETFCIYAEIADLKIPGTAAYIFRSFCTDGELTRFRRINTMDDFGMPNVGRVKQAYHPAELIDSYSVSLRI